MNAAASAMPTANRYVILSFIVTLQCTLFGKAVQAQGQLGQLEELARPCRVLVFSKEDEIVGFIGATEDLGSGPSGEISPQLTAFFTSALILASSVAVNSFSAKAVGHMAPSSRFAVSLKPNVAYLDLNLCALWK